MLSQVRNGTGYRRKKDRTADALAVSVYPSRGLYLVGFEIKVSKSDWRKELADPDKAADMQKWCRHWYVASPQGVVPEGELPANWGLIECTAKTAKIVVKAPELKPVEPDMLLVASILRRAAESTVPAVEVQARIDERVAAIVAAKMHRTNRKLEELTKTVQDFEEASGVQMKHHWDAGRIGEAVKSVLSGDHLQVKPRMEYLRREAQRIVEQCDKSLEGL